ncbi:hypothetical protein THAOC_25046 [Thalassiosira oceanica]|uniref:Uncharacterized protein n=1 Tax=Thalassiosira oceanica TaxID=159749 RepID=K0RQA8_THAOC|nr:hypothetical protein THAOC_25046 [Thalassiosira oceanica]|eukprot:EJK55240.1 hypothetical protein THAOC_25046 [Thalassiosira oceanica]
MMEIDRFPTNSRCLSRRVTSTTQGKSTGNRGSVSPVAPITRCGCLGLGCLGRGAAATWAGVSFGLTTFLFTKIAARASLRAFAFRRRWKATAVRLICLTVCLSTDDDDDDDTSNGRDRGRRQRQRLRLGCAEPAPSPFARSDDAPSGASPGVPGRPREEPEGESWRGKWRRPAQKCQRRRGMQWNSAHKDEEEGF